MAATIPPYSEIEYLVADRIATITLNRPDRLNAFTQVMRDELIGAFDQADSDDDVRAVVVTGRGRAFCAGADLSAGGDTFNADPSLSDWDETTGTYEISVAKQGETGPLRL